MFSIEFYVNQQNEEIHRWIKCVSEQSGCLSFVCYDEMNIPNKQIISYMISFSNTDVRKCISFIETIKHEKNIHIESLYMMRNNKCKMLYASPEYCKHNMDKQSRKSYLENEIFSEDEIRILDALSTKK